MSDDQLYKALDPPKPVILPAASEPEIDDDFEPISIEPEVFPKTPQQLYEEEYTRLSEMYNRLLVEFEEAKSQKPELEKKITDLKPKVAEIEKNFLALKAELTKAEGELRKNLEIIVRLRERLPRVKKDIEQLPSQFEPLRR